MTPLGTARRAERAVARWTTYLLCACLALEAATIASGLARRAWLDRVAAGAPLVASEAAARDARDRAIAGFKLAALACAGLAWLAWLYRAYGNLTLVGSKRTRFAHIWAIAYWLIPVVNLVRPYGVMRDLWLRSASLNDRDGYDDLPPPAVLSWWWALSLVWAASAWLEPLLTRDWRTPAQLAQATDLGIVVSAVGMLAVGLAILVVRGIDRTQQYFE